MQFSEVCSIQLVVKKIIFILWFFLLVVVVDVEFLVQVLGNVLDNVIDFMFENGVIILSVQLMGEKVILQVMDFGCGIFDFVLLCIFD